jgi:hypothetical protein
MTRHASNWRRDAPIPAPFHARSLPDAQPKDRPPPSGRPFKRMRPTRGGAKLASERENSKILLLLLL